jgi:type II secretory pathway pseudopilin PulG
MILVLALLGLIATVTIVGANTISNATGEADAHSAVQTAIAAARRTAVTTGNVVTLHATDKDWTWNGGAENLPAGDTRVLLLGPQQDALSLIGGEVSEQPITTVRFYPDGTCDSFRVEFKRPHGGEVVSIDPWTGATLQSSGDQTP